MKIKYIKNPEVFCVENQSIEEVANMFGVSVALLKSYNNIENVAKGCIIAVPEQTQKNEFSKKQSFEVGGQKTSQSSFNVDFGNRANEEKANASAEEVYYKKQNFFKEEKSTLRHYVVKPADTLEKIASKLGVSKEFLKQKNNISRVFIGQMLFY